MAVSSQPPRRGSYVELRRNSCSIVGRVIWSSETCFGVQAHQKISLPDLVRPRARAGIAAKGRRGPTREPLRYTARRKSSQEIADASARQARAFEFAIVVATVLSFVFLVADQVAGLLSAPLDEVAATLREANQASR